MYQWTNWLGKSGVTSLESGAKQAEVGGLLSSASTIRQFSSCYSVQNSLGWLDGDNFLPEESEGRDAASWASGAGKQVHDTLPEDSTFRVFSFWQACTRPNSWFNQISGFFSERGNNSWHKDYPAHWASTECLLLRNQITFIFFTLWRQEELKESWYGIHKRFWGIYP